tara:strand:- start:1265 stop:1411 length:147 start_codon:yes stop_codon:yes gene_type:complete
MDHLKLAGRPMNKGIDESKIWTAQIYAQTFSFYIDSESISNEITYHVE